MDLNYHISFVGFSNPNMDRSILKTGSGSYRMNIFKEFNYRSAEGIPPLYTMKEEVTDGLPSAYLIYMYSESEYEAAMKLVGSWNHWNKLCTNNSFMNGSKEVQTWSGLKQWREEKEIKDRATMYSLLKIAAATGNVNAQKVLFEKDKVGVRGRPSKAQVEAAAKEAAQHEEFIQEDLKRIRLVASNGK